MGNVESAPGSNQTSNNHWHGSDPNSNPSLRPPPVRSGKAQPHQLLQRKGSSFLDEPVTHKLTERGEALVTLDETSATTNTNEGREGSPPSAGVGGTNDNNKLQYAVSEMQGWRSHMEDKHILNSKLLTSSSTSSRNTHTELLKDHHIFAVFDGHGGDMASHYCGEHFVPTLVAQPEWKDYLKLTNESSSRSSSSTRGLALLKSALTSTFHDLDIQLMQAQRSKRLVQLAQLERFVYEMGGGGAESHEVFQKGSPDYNRVLNFDRTLISSLPANIPLERSGSTAVVVLVTPSHFVCANAGDSRAILSKRMTTATATDFRGMANGVLPLSFDHKPNNDAEVCRVERDGGFVRNGRVDGDLAVSRSFGDFGYKNCVERDYDGSMSDSTSSSSLSSSSEPKEFRVTVHPDILVHIREPTKDEFLVLACDGIWDRLTNRNCAELVRALVHEEGETDVGLICEEVIDTALEMDSRDNMTCCLVMFPGAKLGSSISSCPPRTTSQQVSSSRISGGVLKLRAGRELTWGNESTPAKRAHQRLEERNKKRREVLALQKTRPGRRQRQGGLQISSSKDGSERSKGMKHKAPTQARSGKSLRLQVC